MFGLGVASTYSTVWPVHRRHPVRTADRALPISSRRAASRGEHGGNHGIIRHDAPGERLGRAAGDEAIEFLKREQHPHRRTDLEVRSTQLLLADHAAVEQAIDLVKQPWQFGQVALHALITRPDLPCEDRHHRREERAHQRRRRQRARDIGEPLTLGEVMAKAPPDQSARNRLQNGLTPTFGFPCGDAGHRIPRVQPSRHQLVKRFSDRPRPLNPAAVGQLHRRHRRPSEPERPQARRMRTADQLDVSIIDTGPLEHPAHSENWMRKRDPVETKGALGHGGETNRKLGRLRTIALVVQRAATSPTRSRETSGPPIKAIPPVWRLAVLK